MKYLNLMQNKLKPREVNDALINGGGGGGSGVPDYSYDEVDTGVKWLDGRKIYMRAYPSTLWDNLTFSGQTLTKLFDAPEYVDGIIDALIVTVNTSGAKILFRPFAFLENNSISVGGISSTTSSGDFVLWYVKTETN